MRPQVGSRPQIKTRTSLIFIIPKGCSDRRRDAPEQLAIAPLFIRTKTSQKIFQLLGIDRRRTLFNRIRRRNRHTLERIFGKRLGLLDLDRRIISFVQPRRPDRGSISPRSGIDSRRQQVVEHPHDGTSPLARCGFPSCGAPEPWLDPPAARQHHGAMGRQCDPGHATAKMADLHAPIAIGANRLPLSPIFGRHPSSGEADTSTGQAVTEAAHVKPTIYTQPAKIVIGPMSKSLRKNTRSCH